MTKIKDIINHLEIMAPLSYQESYDNSGLITGDETKSVQGILICLDAVEKIVDEAIKKKCNLIVAHHPIIFSGIKKLTGKNYVEKTIIKAIKNNIAIYAMHTNLDNVMSGVNAKICQKLMLESPTILSPRKSTLKKLITFAPLDHAEKVLEALYEAGAGQIGAYKNCSFSVEGKGTFMPTQGTNPFIGSANEAEAVKEQRLELILPAHASPQIIQALQASHPYETVAYYLQDIENENQEVGSGMVGKLSSPMPEEQFLSYLKDKMALNCIRHTGLLGRPVQKIAVCGGAGKFLLPTAIRQKADVFISADFKYHEFFDAEDHIVIMDVGHYESEVFTKDLIYEIINKKFTNIALNFTEQDTNPISYY